jgi:hypothetical protein
MTAQIGEILEYEGETYSMCTEPLGQYFAVGGREPGFAWTSTANWRGYVGEWQILDGRLYLIGIEGELKDGSTATLETVFPGFPDRVFAHWYTGTIRIPQGKLLNYEHMDYESTYERDLFLEIEKGCLLSTHVRVNGESGNPNSPEGYGIGGMTVFPNRPGEDE